MSTTIRLGPSDHDRPMTYDEFMSGDYEEGYRYELIDGRLYVSPMPNYPHDWVEQHVFEALRDYTKSHPEVLSKVTNKARIFVPGARRTTAPEPDIAVYVSVPKGPDVAWQEINPLIVVEVLSGEDPKKDLERNVELYLRVPSIEEYWVVDIRESPARPTLIVHRRRDKEWDAEEFDADATYSTPLLPGFELRVSPAAD